MILYDLYCLKYELNGLKIVTFCVIFQFLTMFNTVVGAGAALGYGSGSDQMMRLRLRNTGLTNIIFIPLTILTYCILAQLNRFKLRFIQSCGAAPFLCGSG
jgi:hypothetical protein